MRKALLVAGMLVAALAAPGGFADDKADAARIADLVRDLSDPETHVQDEARDRLAAMGAKAVLALTDLLDTGTPAVKVHAAKTLGAIGPDAQFAKPALAKAAESPDKALAAAAAEAIKKIDATGPWGAGGGATQLPTPEQLAAALAAPKRDEALALIRTLGAAQGPVQSQAAKTMLLPLLVHPEGAVRFAAVRAVGKLGTNAAGAEDEVAKLLGDLAVPVRYAALDALRTVDPRGGAALARLKALHTDRADPQRARPWLLSAIRAAGTNASITAASYLASEDPVARAAGAEAFGVLTDCPAEALDRLVKALADTSGQVQRVAAGALGMRGAPALSVSVPALLAALESPDSRCQVEAAEALGLILRDAATKPVRPVKTTDVDKAITNGLGWLAKHQEDDGSFDSDNFMRHDPANDPSGGPGEPVYDSGLTALAALAFVRAGDDPARSEPATSAVRFLVQGMSPDGRIFSPAESMHWVYPQTIGTLALCEAYERGRDPVTGEAAQRALDYVASIRNPDAGWRYGIHDGDSDTSVGGWCVTAFDAARRAGLRIDEGFRAPVMKYLDSCTDATGKGGYTPKAMDDARTADATKTHPIDKTESMTASALAQRLALGQDPKSPVVAKAVERCLAIRPQWDRALGTIDLYYWYYGTTALHRVGGEPWRKWRTALREALVPQQGGATAGSRNGSWDPLDPWGKSGGRIYTTAMAVLCLEIHDERVVPPGRPTMVDGKLAKTAEVLRKLAADPSAREPVRKAAAAALASYEAL